MEKNRFVLKIDAGINLFCSHNGVEGGGDPPNHFFVCFDIYVCICFIYVYDTLGFLGKRKQSGNRH